MWLLRGAGDPLGTKQASSRAEKQRFPKDGRMELTLDQFVMCTTGRSLILILHQVYSFFSQLHLNRYFDVHSLASFYSYCSLGYSNSLCFILGILCIFQTKCWVWLCPAVILIQMVTTAPGSSLGLASCCFPEQILERVPWCSDQIYLLCQLMQIAISFENHICICIWNLRLFLCPSAGQRSCRGSDRWGRTSARQTDRWTGKAGKAGG